MSCNCGEGDGIAGIRLGAIGGIEEDMRTTGAVILGLITVGVVGLFVVGLQDTGPNRYPARAKKRRKR